MEAWILAVCPGSWTSDLQAPYRSHTNEHARTLGEGWLFNWASQTDERPYYLVRYSVAGVILVGFEWRRAEPDRRVSWGELV